MRLSLAHALGVVALAATTAFGADQLVSTKQFVVKTKPGDATKTKITYKAKEKASTATLVGDPTAGGATLHVSLEPGGDQCFSLPASGWTGSAEKGFKYKDADLANGAVKSAAIKLTGKGTFTLSFSLQGKGAEVINIVPGNPTSTYGTNLTIDGGDSYCAGDGAAAKKNDEKQFSVKNGGAPSSCIAVACGGSPSGAFLDR